MARRTADEIVELLRSNGRLNRARQQFSNWRAKISNLQEQRTSLSPVEMRRLEFEAVEAIVQAYNDSDTRS